MYKVGLALRINAQKKNGEYPINVKVKIDDSHHQMYSTGVSVLTEHWNEQAQEVSRLDNLYYTKNKTISELLSKAEKILLRCELDGNLSYKVFANEYNPKKLPDTKLKDTSKGKNVTDEKPKHCFFELAAKYIDLKKGSWSKGKR